MLRLPLIRARFARRLLCLLTIGGLASNLTVTASSSFSGKVISVLPDRQAITVSSGEDAAPITVDVGSGDDAIAREGWEIRGEIVPYAGRQLLQNIMPNNRADVALIQRLDRQLQQDTLTRGSKAFRSIGDTDSALCTLATGWHPLSQ